jgi:hypothetical protein
MDIPGDRNGEFKTSVVPRGKQYEEDVVRDCGILFLAGVRTRPLFMISGWRLFSGKRFQRRRSSPSKFLLKNE